MLVALFVLVVAIVPMLTLDIQANRTDLMARQQSVAANVAKQEIETLSAQQFPAGSVPETSFTLPSYIGSLYPTAAMAGSYTITVAGTAPHQIEQIAVQVTWTRPDSTTSSVRLDTVVAQ